MGFLDTEEKPFGDPWESMPDMPPSTNYVAKQHLVYSDWLAKGKTLCDQNGTIQWNIGDWLLDGQVEFDYKELVDVDYTFLQKTARADGSSGYKGPMVPNFWKDAAAEVHMEVSTLKEMAKTARTFPKAERIARLSFTHHRIAAQAENKEKLNEYLMACLKGIEEGQTPRSVAFLVDVIRQDEHNAGLGREVIPGGRHVRFPVSEEIWKKLKDVAKYKSSSVPDTVTTCCTTAIEAYLEEMAKTISMEKFGLYEDGTWPFGASAGEPKGNKATRRRKRQDHKPEVRSHGRAMAHTRWIKRNEPVLA